MRRIAFLIVALCAATALAGDLYRWVDEEGRVHYADSPPPGVKADKLDVRSRPTDPNALAHDAAADADKKRVEAEVERMKHEEALTAKEAADAKAEDCAAAQKHLADMRDERKIAVVGTDGKETWARGDDAIKLKDKAAADVAAKCGD